MPKKKKTKSAPGIGLGCLAKDSITGFTGIVVGWTKFGYGCVHIRLQAQGLAKSGDPVPVHSFDDQRIEVLAPPAKSWPEPKKSEIKLGHVVRDTLTDAVGVVTGLIFRLDGGIDVLLERPGLTDDGEPKSPLYVNAERVMVVEKRELKVSKTSTATGGGPMARGASLVA